MGSDPNLPPRITFGPFEYNPSAGELRKHGTRLRLTGHPLQILEVLLERGNQVVAREELQKRLWNGTTFVDFDHGLNAAMNKLRQTLGDSADEPRYVETVPGKGYRFVASITQDSPLPIAPPEGVASPPPEILVTTPPPEEDLTVARPRSSRLIALTGLGVLATAVAAGIWFFGQSTRQPATATSSVAQPVRYQVAVPDGLELGPSQLFSLSPDGRNLVYFAKSTAGGPYKVWVQSLDSVKPRSLPFNLSSESLPFWSPDSKFIAFTAEGRLKKADLTGNPAEDIRPIPGMMIGATWSNKGTILFGTESSAILRVDAANAEPVPVTVRDITTERVHIFPVFLPDGKHFLYSRVLTDPNKTGVYLGAVDAKPEEQSLTRLIATSFAPQFALSSDGNGVILFQRDKTLWGQKFDTSRLQMLGEPAVLAERLGNTRAYGFFAASRDVLIHRSGTADMGQLTWMNRRGQRLGTLGEAADHYDFRGCISPDGSKIALTRGGSESTDIWVHDLSRDVVQRLTFEPSIDQAPIWSPDGKNLVFSSSRNGRFDLYQVSSHGGGGPELLYASRENKFASSWSADGRFILFSTENRDGIWVLPLESTGKRTPVSILRSPGNERSAVFSPDSRWIGYVSNESGQPEVYVQRFSFAVPGSPGPKVLISRGGGMSPRWRADGKEIFYRAPDGNLMAVPFTAEPALQAGVPKPLFKTGWLWEATGDGNRFLVDVPVEHGVPPFTVVLNWQSGLKH